MISLKSSLNDYDRAQTLVSRLRAAFLATLNAIRQYAITADPASADRFRSQVSSILSEVEQGDRDEKSVEQASAGIRGLLRDYQDRVDRYIQELRASLKSTTDVLRETIAALQSDDSDAEKQLKTEIGRLQSVDKLNNLDDIRTCVRRTVASLTGCVDQLRREKDVVIAQLRDEIRTLQKSMEEAHRATAIDAVTGAYQRSEFERIIKREIVRGEPVTVIRLWLQNIHTLAARSPIDQLLAAFCKRAHEVVPAESMARWQEDVFCVLVPRADARTASAALVQKCGGIYAYMDGDKARTLHLQLGVACLASTPDADVDAFLKKIDVPAA